MKPYIFVESILSDLSFSYVHHLNQRMVDDMYSAIELSWFLQELTDEKKDSYKFMNQ